jgi:hypothetical protein
MSVAKGDVVSILKEGENGWLFGEIRGSAGWFPSQCVNRKESIICRVRARAVFRPENDTELALQPGDIVSVLSQEDRTWWIGFISDRAGYFPASFVDVVPDAPAEQTDLPEKTRQDLATAELEINRLRRECRIHQDAGKLEQRLRGNIEATVRELEQRLSASNTELVQLRESNARSESAARALQDRLRDEESARTQLHEQLVQADARLQEETRARMVAVLQVGDACFSCLGVLFTR